MGSVDPPWEPIEGETPIDDISGLRLLWIKTRGHLNEAEAENIRKATIKYLAAPPTKRLAPFTETWLYKLHRDMYCDVWKWAGKKRRSEKSIGVHVYEIDVALYNLLQDLQAWHDSGMDWIEQGAYLHHRAVYIHPFENGNGRWSRMLANIWLRRHGQPMVQWPEVALGESSDWRKTYLKAVRAADDGDLRPLIDFHRRHTQF